jgi:hypothetical protein
MSHNYVCRRRTLLSSIPDAKRGRYGAARLGASWESLLSLTNSKQWAARRRVLVAVFALGFNACTSQHERNLPGDSIAGTLAEPTTLKIALPLEVSESAHEFSPVVFRDGLEFAHVFSIRNNSDHLVLVVGMRNSIDLSCGPASRPNYP